LPAPRDTSKSELNSGCFGIFASAPAISCCSSADGVHTFSMLTLTLGCCDAESAGCCDAGACAVSCPKHGTTNKDVQRRKKRILATPEF